MPPELLRRAAQTKRIFNIVLGSIAAISLLGDGIGIMNIMLTSVTEHTREIGIRCALRARRHDMIVQFFVAFTISTLVGIIFGLYPAFRAGRMDPVEARRHE